LPAQKLVNGARLRLVVVDGVIERIDTSALPPQIRDHIAAILAPLAGQHGVTQSAIERRLLLAGDTPGTALRSTLARGTDKGGTVLVIEANYHIITGSLSVDNTLPSSLGTWTTGVGLALNSAAGFGEQIYVHAGGDLQGGGNGFFTQDPRNRALAAGFVVPLGTDGLSFNLEGTDTRSTPKPVFAAVPTQSQFDRISARLNYALIRSRSLTVNLNGSFDAENESTSALLPGTTVALSLDRLRVFRSGADALWLSPWNATVTGRLTASFGVDGLGARNAADATPLLPLSRQGADADFQKLQASIDYVQPLAEHLAIDVKAAAQTSFGQPLAQAEEFGIDGPQALSSFAVGTLLGDAGAYVRGEVQAPFTVPFAGGAAVLAPYLFGAAGAVRVEEPTAVEQQVVQAASYGLGVRLGVAPTASFTNASVTFEWARGDCNDNLSGVCAIADRFTLIGSLQF
jgi:hemolysin activation/secretion protein